MFETIFVALFVGTPLVMVGLTVEAWADCRRLDREILAMRARTGERRFEDMKALVRKDGGR